MAVVQPAQVTKFFEGDSNTFSYVVKDPSSSACAVIDSALNFDYASGTISFESADEIIQFIEQNNLSVEWLIETHVHADHLSAAPYIQKHVGGKLGIGEQISVVQSVFGKVFNEGAGFARDGSQFDHLFTDGERYTVGQLSCFALHTPGHTPACMTHVLGDAAFVGDTLFMPDAGTARCDFPGGSAETLYHSVQRILALEEDTRIFMCHDYAPNGRDLLFQTTVAEQRKKNIHVGEGIAKEDFVMMREARDATLDMPRLILPSLQVNMKAGHLPEPESNGLSYLKIPLNAFQ
ncbi:MBL fold metallo-hydrolase [Oleiphilus sp. HI0071]|nr:MULTISPECIES: MBL fold metallo-hydrolase [unclassified Oleiphilus]KZY74776.1 MBL fold metallo-hydrolase [Oleiphilus sp. HI0065]KZY87103.1 MBL fold metallo-hydrolase [Oleiphilus sp. HI0071]KZY91271.1 MBL fold metallo-hydrolase [Oleiphilus sp. HI0073]KZZ42295.1 MBL fold metallo-hydrolase [Oleiphilus sp. HI0118]KZZ60258.1 MBL fold metallo-hydrolase [Oleiphilus sp. HI0122]KZZ65191.1 MBL fold metallo-hydrolase [Oleiphilus sp. HI0130]KZZ82100.1 MBL fold metallo-hydrolase [Oleiphilus sp. HI0133]